LEPPSLNRLPRARHDTTLTTRSPARPPTARSGANGDAEHSIAPGIRTGRTTVGPPREARPPQVIS
ncbi:MAG: hypothetical protein M3256_22890, partial [Actinomycetota bacterium]|nr:hypothetical protein [Actinomycetota bacterium]